MCAPVGISQQPLLSFKTEDGVQLFASRALLSVDVFCYLDTTLIHLAGTAGHGSHTCEHSLHVGRQYSQRLRRTLARASPEVGMVVLSRPLSHPPSPVTVFLPQELQAVRQIVRKPSLQWKSLRTGVTSTVSRQGPESHNTIYIARLRGFTCSKRRACGLLSACRKSCLNFICGVG